VLPASFNFTKAADEKNAEDLIKPAGEGKTNECVLRTGNNAKVML
jgi:hypothetical protein